MDIPSLKSKVLRIAYNQDGDDNMDRQQAHELLDRLGPTQFATVAKLLEVMVRDFDDELSEEDLHAISASREFFREGNEGLSFEQLVAECGFTMDQLRNCKRD